MLILCLVVCVIAGVNHFLKEKPAPAAPVAVKVEPTPPSLKRIGIKNRSDINNAVIKEINKNGLLFQCDEGLVQAPLADLPEDFQSYYEKAIKEAATKKTSVTRQSYQPIQQETYQSYDRSSHTQSTEDAAIDKAGQKAMLRREIQSCESTIDQYNRQSSTTSKKGGDLISSEDYEYAKAKLEKAKSEYSALQ